VRAAVFGWLVIVSLHFILSVFYLRFVLSSTEEFELGTSALGEGSLVLERQL
jgi:hypothetical protein